MFDLAWSEIALIAVVALVVIGPKDLPDAVRGVARMVRKARTMASEMQGHVDEMVREANLHEVRDQINEIRNFNIRDTIEKHVDKDGTIRSSFDNPLQDTYKPYTPPPMPDVPAPDPNAAPAFIPPGAETAGPVLPAGPPAFVPPAFIPPEPAPVADHPPAPPVAAAPEPPPAPVAAAVPQTTVSQS